MEEEDFIRLYLCERGLLDSTTESVKEIPLEKIIHYALYKKGLWPSLIDPPPKWMMNRMKRRMEENKKV